LNSGAAAVERLNVERSPSAIVRWPFWPHDIREIFPQGGSDEIDQMIRELLADKETRRKGDKEPRVRKRRVGKKAA
jgi:hypothetical protein